MSNTVQKYDQNDRIELYTVTAFQDASATAFDPDTVRFEVLPPSGTLATYTAGTDNNVTNTATGIYRCAIDLDEVGAWSYRIIGETSSGENRGSAAGYFEVKPNPFG